MTSCHCVAGLGRTVIGHELSHQLGIPGCPPTERICGFEAHTFQGPYTGLGRPHGLNGKLLRCQVEVGQSDNFAVGVAGPPALRGHERECRSGV